MKNILITGAAGFIGANFVEYFLNKYSEYNIIALDKLTYAGNIENLNKVKEKIIFIQADICDYEKIKQVFEEYKINGVINFAAESHVDNSIQNPFIFTQTNIVGTHTLLEVARQAWGEGSLNKFVHISTDEVYGTLEEDGYFTEDSKIDPSSPYSASKASSDLMVLAYYKTFKMNVNVTNCSNSYGPYQHNEKLIPYMLKLVLENKKLPVYGQGLNIRDWIYVKDHCEAIDFVYHNGKKGQRYNVGGHCEKRNIDVIRFLLKYLKKSEDLITFIEDRKGHDYRYAVDTNKIEKELGWKPKTKFEDGISKTIEWYLENREWLK